MYECVCCIAFTFFYSHWCMEIKCDGNNTTGRSTKKKGQDGSQVREKNNSHFFLFSLFFPFHLLFFIGRMKISHQNLMRYYSCLKYTRNIPLLAM
jgi:hypothetical protein